MYLEEKHLEKAKEIVLKHRKKRSCKKCYDRGYVGLTLENTLVVCDKCIDIDQAMDEWKEYVKLDEKLVEDFHDLFEEEPQEEGAEEENKEHEGEE
ncbi:MAG TPA: hypothetical protein PKZ69_05315 [Candidatus Cloacimonadota bacterium]|nr:hypothetical protein [Candidatus Cloacimonadota bacterium]HPK41024.1 hypothetical protein [Candidatus Cloacimonadota bacterium]